MSYEHIFGVEYERRVRQFLGDGKWYVAVVGHGQGMPVEMPDEAMVRLMVGPLLERYPAARIFSYRSKKEPSLGMTAAIFPQGFETREEASGFSAHCMSLLQEFSESLVGKGGDA